MIVLCKCIIYFGLVSAPSPSCVPPQTQWSPSSEWSFLLSCHRYIFLCICIFKHVNAYSNMCVHLYVCMQVCGGSRSMWGIFLDQAPLYALRWGFSVEPRYGLSSQIASGSFVSIFWGLGLQVGLKSIRHLCGFRRSELWPSCSCSEHFVHWTTLPAP